MKVIICPISTERIPEHISRLTALLVVLLLIAYLISGNLIFPVILITDFLSRSFYGGKLSVLAYSSKIISNTLSLNSKMVDKAPKIFAARLGLLFSILLFVTALLHLKSASLAIVVLFGVCAFLEFAISFCVGCFIYTFIVTLYSPSTK